MYYNFSVLDMYSVSFLVLKVKPVKIEIFKILRHLILDVGSWRFPKIFYFLFTWKFKRIEHNRISGLGYKSYFIEVWIGLNNKFRTIQKWHTKYITTLQHLYKRQVDAKGLEETFKFFSNRFMTHLMGSFWHDKELICSCFSCFL